MFAVVVGIISAVGLLSIWRRPEEPPVSQPSSMQVERLEFDFGKVLTVSNQILTHTFQYRNQGRSPLQIAGISNGKPCCGTVDPVSQTVVRPGESLAITVRVTVGGKLGPDAHLAVVEFSEPERRLELFTHFDAMPAAVLRHEAGSDSASRRMLCGEPSTHEASLIIASREGDPEVESNDLKVSSNLRSRIDSRIRMRPRVAEIRETMFNLTFDLPPRDRPGVQSEDVEILVGGKSILRDTIRWEVHAAVVAAPSSLMSSSEASRDLTLLVRAMDDRPFRILGIDAIPKGVTSRGLDDATRPRHSIRFL